MSLPIFKITADATKFSEAMRDLQRATGKQMPAIIKQQTKIFLEKFVEYQRPESGPKGRERVRRDIMWVFRPATSTGADAAAVAKAVTNDAVQRENWSKKIKTAKLRNRFDEYVTKGNVFGIETMLRRMRLATSKGEGGSYRILPVVTSVNPAQHAAARNSRGTVPRNTRNAVIFSGRMAELSDYIKKIQSHVGLGESGWKSAALAVKARLPVYVRNAPTRGEGGVKLHAEKGDGKTFITIWNTNKGAVEQDRRSGLVSRVAKQRIKDLRATVNRIVEREAKKVSAK